MSSVSPAPLYFDYAAATPVDPRVLAVMQPYLSEQFYNPSALYRAAGEVRRDVEAARAVVAQCLGARPAEIVFTAGGSEANNLAVRGVMSSDAGRAGTLLVSAIEHDSVLGAAGGYHVGHIPVLASGVVDVDAFGSMLDDSVVLVSVMYANNEIGTIQPIRRLADILHTTRRSRQMRGITRPLYLHVDASQAANYLDLSVSRLGVDLMTLNGGKVYGPKQTGALYVRAGIELTPLVHGGGQERGLRSGTENVAGIVGFAAALQLTYDMRHDETRRLQILQGNFIKQLKSRFPTAVVNGSLRHRLPNNVHVTFKDTDNERLIFALDEAGIMAAAGSACSASSQTPSHVLRACGIDDETARASLRFTLGRATVQADIDRLMRELSRLIG